MKNHVKNRSDAQIRKYRKTGCTQKFTIDMKTVDEVRQQGLVFFTEGGVIQVAVVADNSLRAYEQEKLQPAWSLPRSWSIEEG